MKVGKRETLVIYFAILVSVVLLFYQVIYKPQKREIKAIQKEVKALETDLENLNRIIPALPAIEEEIRQEQASWMQMEARSPAGKQMVRIIRQLAQESSQWQINLVSIKPFQEVEARPAQGETSLKKISFRIQIRSQYQAFAAFLQALENNSSFLAMVQDFHVSKKDEDETGLNLDIMVNICSYVA